MGKTKTIKVPLREGRTRTITVEQGRGWSRVVTTIEKPVEVRSSDVYEVQA